MYFTKNEIITLNNKKKYLVIDTAIVDDVVYYKIKEVNNEENKIISEILYITTTYKDGKIYINDKLSSSEIDKIKESFES